MSAQTPRRVVLALEPGALVERELPAASALAARLGAELLVTFGLGPELAALQQGPASVARHLSRVGSAGQAASQLGRELRVQAEVARRAVAALGPERARFLEIGGQREGLASVVEETDLVMIQRRGRALGGLLLGRDHVLPLACALHAPVLLLDEPSAPAQRSVRLEQAVLLIGDWPGAPDLGIVRAWLSEATPLRLRRVSLHDLREPRHLQPGAVLVVHRAELSALDLGRRQILAACSQAVVVL